MIDREKLSVGGKKKEGGGRRKKKREGINIKGEIYIHTEGDEKENRNKEEEG